jgi:diphthamide biosynthesis protein 7
MENSSLYNIIFLSKTNTQKNVDRVKFVHNPKNKNEVNILAALYHLDRESRVKSGGFQLFSIDSTNHLSCIQDLLLEYGVLDMKFNKNTIFSSNSNSSFSIFEYEEDSSHISFLKNISIPQKVNNNENTCNTLDISCVEYDQSILLSMNDGSFHLYSLEKDEFTSNHQAHEYGLWSCLILDQNTFLTGSEDSILKMWDKRTDLNKAVSVNKEHSASINCIYKYFASETEIITGSYDESLRIIDIRNLTSTIEKKKLNHSIWDINQQILKGKNYLLMSCIYEGFRIYEVQKGNDLIEVMKMEISQDEDNKHGTIVYGVDCFQKEDCLNISSCSFYDNKILYWQFK